MSLSIFDKLTNSQRDIEEIHIDNHTTHYVISICWGLLDVDTKTAVSLKAAKEYINKRFGDNNKIPVLR